MIQQDISFPDADKGYICSCCGQLCKRYFRKFNSNMAVALIFLYRIRERGFVHIENLMIESGFKRCGDASYLRHYNLIEAADKKREDGSRRNGHYRITGVGIMFVEKKIKVKQSFIIYNNKFEGFEGDEITIDQALGKKFSYDELMKGEYVIYQEGGY